MRTILVYKLVADVDENDRPLGATLYESDDYPPYTVRERRFDTLNAAFQFIFNSLMAARIKAGLEIAAQLQFEHGEARGNA